MNLDNKISNSTKWSLFTEVFSKLVTPVTSMILARLLAPEAFGVLATVQMVLSFSEMLADAGFQKYVIQKQFSDDKEKEQSILVAIYTNVALAMLIWFFIFVFSERIAVFVGNPGLGNVLTVAGINIVLVSFSSVQLALMRREFEFKKIMFFRFITVVTPLIVTVPLALLGFEYWSLIIGFICSNLFQTVAVCVNSNIFLYPYYNFEQLKNMLNFSIWTLIESIFIWLTAWCDVFIVSSLLGEHYLGVYKMSMSSVNSLLAIISGTVFPVLYSALCRLQSNQNEYKNTLFKLCSRTALVVIPLGCGLLGYRDVARNILFGQLWHEADLMIGLWGITSCIMIIYGHFCSEVYRSLGKPKVSTIAQLLHMLFLIPMIYCFSDNFTELVIVRNLVRFEGIFVHFFIMYYVIRINPMNMLAVTWQYLLASFAMLIFIVWCRGLLNNIYMDLCTIPIAVIFYFFILLMFADQRKILKEIVSHRSIL